MSLKDKYSELIAEAQAAKVSDLSITESDGVLYVNGATSALVKDRLWKIYDKIDPDMRSADLVLDISVVAGGEEIYEVKPGDSLSKIAKKYPGMTWQKIFEANKHILKDPDRIYPKQLLKIPL
ncbi:MAG: LysM peptidoglycan-binding domain-containing protein [Bacteroidales bacterium]|jgi:nucleoid-associated protein YgaU|nr:LysM peptidoglycan-binding domain-containing protein [Bacteroidales bacterium]